MGRKQRVIYSLILTGLLLLAGFSPVFSSLNQDDPPDAAYVSGVRGYPQSYGLSCESRSAVDWAAFYGVSISETDFLFGLGFSDHPDLGFVGDPNGPWGYIPPNPYGVHAKPVAALLQAYGLPARAQRGMVWDELRIEIAAGRPVIVWIIGDIWPGTPVSYSTPEGGDTLVARFEHTMILVGYDARQVHLLDSASGLTKTYSLSSFLSSWAVLGNMAVTGDKPQPAPQEEVPGVIYTNWHFLPALFMAPRDGSVNENEPEPSGDDSSPSTYVVQNGDYLIAVAERFGLDWLSLAQLNAIGYPYVIYPGQILQLK